MEDHWAKKFRILTLSLIFSGALNIGLVATLIAIKTEDGRPNLAASPKKSTLKVQKISNLAVLDAMSKLSFRELVTLLTNRELIEEGYAKRDLAVSALAAYHHFNLEKALSSTELQKRTLILGENRSLELYPGLSDEQFEAIIRFAYQEKWPLTGQGLFALIKKIPGDESLAQAFLLTPEFYAIQALFQKTEAAQDPALLLQLIAEGNWDLLNRFAKEQEQMLDLSVEKRRRLLLSYLTNHSPTAAKLLLKTDLDFVLKRLDDRGILDLLSMIGQKSEEAQEFCVALLQSHRSDAVWNAAVTKLYAFAGEPLPEPFDLRAAAARFAPSKVVTSESKKLVITVAPEPAAARFHTVQEGESLWKIARQYKVKVEELVQLNGIEKDKLFPGMTIKIPD